MEINNLNKRKKKDKEFQRDAQYCISNCFMRTGINPKMLPNLSSEIFEDKPRMYLNPTESLNFRSYVKPDSRVLTVLGSGDFALDSIYHGAKEVVTFDINKFQLYPAALKLEAFSIMDYDTYYSFFCDSTIVDEMGKYYLSPDVYKSFRKDIKASGIRAFWDTIMDQRQRDIKLRKPNPYLNMIIENTKGSIDAIKEVYLDEVLKMNGNPLGIPIDKILRIIIAPEYSKIPGSYIENEESFIKAQEMSKDSEIYYSKSNLQGIINKLKNAKKDGEFDLIYLSNVPEYIESSEFKEILDTQLLPLLAETGEIVYCCQGTDINTITNQNDSLQKYRQIINSSTTTAHDMINAKQTINSIEQYADIEGRYNVTLDAETTFGGKGASFSESTDTFVRIKK